MLKLKRFFALLLLFISATTILAAGAGRGHVEEGTGVSTVQVSLHVSADKAASPASLHIHEDPFQDQEQDCSGSSQCAHTCHFGHCSYTTADATYLSRFGKASALLSYYFFDYDLVRLSDLTRPPSPRV